MKALRTSLVLGAVAAALAGACEKAGGKPKPGAHVPGRITHVVLCWLKEPGNAEHRKRIVEASRRFAAIPGVVGVRAGEVVPSEREIVDDSFDVAICVTFTSPEDLAGYIDHPDHKRAAKEVLFPLVEKVVVHDFVE
ncbi:MAG: Dabb family protein [Planctomycetota bacterium]|jgi:hypothetical protein